MAVIDVSAFGASSLADNNTPSILAAVAAASTDDEIIGTPGALYQCREATDIAAITLNKRLHWRGEWGMSMANDDAMDADPAYNHHATLYLNSGASGSTFTAGLRFEGSKDGAGAATEYFDPSFVPSPLEHHRAIFCNAATDILFEDIAVRNYTGDAIQLYNSCERYVFRRCVMEWCGRDHITLSPFEDLTPVRDVLIEDCTLRGASNQQVDNEHGGAHRIIVRRNYMECANNVRSIGLCLAGSGTDINAPSTYWEIYDNVIVGAMRFTWTSNSVVRGNTFNNARQTSGIELERGQTGNLISGNTINCTQTATTNLAGIYANGTVGGGSSVLSISGNTITMAKAQAFGIRLDGIVDASVSGNTLIGAGSAAAGYYGVRVRTTVNDRNCVLFVCAGNTIKDFGAAGIAVHGNVAAPDAVCEEARVYSNKLSNTSPSGPMTTGIALNPDGLDVVQAALVTENSFGQGVTTGLGTLPDGAEMSYSFPAPENTPRAWFSTGGFLGGGL